jgi:anti-anti-sigma regulatory factor
MLARVSLLLAALILASRGAARPAQRPARDSSARPASAGAATIRGRVIAGDTGKPLRRAPITASAPPSRSRSSSLRGAPTRPMQQIPTRAQNFLEWLIEKLDAFLEGILGRPLADETFWFLGSIFIFILTSNVRAEGSIVHFTADHVRDRIGELVAASATPPRLVIMTMAAVPFLDLAGSEVVFELHKSLTAQGAAFRIAEARDAVCDALRRADSNGRFDLTGAKLPVAEAIV